MNELLNELRAYFSLKWSWIALILVAALGILWNILSILKPFIHSAPPSSEAYSLTRVHRAPSSVQPDLNAPLFGSYVPDIRQEEVADSKLSYVIVGIMHSTNPHNSQVLIQGEDGFSKVYKEGDFLTPQLQIKEIQGQGVIISNQGRFERLSLPKNELRFDPIPVPLIMKED